MAVVSIFNIGHEAIDQRLSSEDPDLAVYRAILGRPPATHVSKKNVEAGRPRAHRGVIGTMRGLFGGAREKHRS